MNATQTPTAEILAATAIVTHPDQFPAHVVRMAAEYLRTGR